MSSNRVLSLMAILILLLAACAAGGEEPAASEAQHTPTPESGLATVPPTDGNRAEEGEATKEQSTMSAGENDSSSDTSSSDNASSEDVIAPVEVDLSEMAPDTPAEGSEGGEAVELPEPGRPKPQIAMVNQAAQDLAKRLDIEINAVEVVAAEEIEWPDSSLGCPSADGYYRQVVKPGFRITLRAGGETYDYHTDTSRTVILCGPDGHPVP